MWIVVIQTNSRAGPMFRKSGWSPVNFEAELPASGKLWWPLAWHSVPFVTLKMCFMTTVLSYAIQATWVRLKHKVSTDVVLCPVSHTHFLWKGFFIYWLCISCWILIYELLNSIWICFQISLSKCFCSQMDKKHLF